MTIRKGDLFEKKVNPYWINPKIFNSGKNDEPFAMWELKNHGDNIRLTKSLIIMMPMDINGQHYFNRSTKNFFLDNAKNRKSL